MGFSVKKGWENKGDERGEPQGQRFETQRAFKKKKGKKRLDQLELKDRGKVL